MKIYLVGGAVRDALINRPTTDYDFVVVGSSPEEMLGLGYQQVGADFPVFLHPVTRNEYALARTERKSGSGYNGFISEFDSTVTLEDDLMRRDLTINALAQLVIEHHDDGTFMVDDRVIDHHGGVDDLHNGILRHVSSAFKDDPVRVLRIARFAARYGFVVGAETHALLCDISAGDELRTLTAERVWKELESVLGYDDPTPFFDVLKSCHALEIIFPEIYALYGIPQPARWHPEIDTGIHTIMTLKQACQISLDKTVRFAALVHDLGKAVTPPDKLPSHPGHEAAGVPIVNVMCDRLKIPSSFRRLAVAVCANHLLVHKAFELRASTIVTLFRRLDIRRRPETLAQFLDAVEADARGRLGMADRPYNQRLLIEAAAEAMTGVTPQAIIEAGHTGKKVDELLQQAQIKAVNRKLIQLKKELDDD